jgi:hypothetical protein
MGHLRLLHEIKKYSKAKMIHESKDDKFMNSWVGFTPD